MSGVIAWMSRNGWVSPRVGQIANLFHEHGGYQFVAVTDYLLFCRSRDQGGRVARHSRRGRL